MIASDFVKTMAFYRYGKMDTQCGAYTSALIGYSFRESYGSAKSSLPHDTATGITSKSDSTLYNHITLHTAL